jgi:hypothetical protein
MDKETLHKLGKECMDLISKKISHRLNPEEFYIEILNLHKEFPISGHNQPLTPFQIDHYLEMDEIQISDKGIKYFDHIQPLNFQEAAEMYIRHSQKKPRLPGWLQIKERKLIK